MNTTHAEKSTINGIIRRASRRKRDVLILFLTGLLLTPWCSQTDAQILTKTVQLNGHNFTLPIGFEITLAAGPPLIERPITADFDDEGRLYVSDSSGSNENVNLQLKKKPHRIVRLEASAGRFDKSVVFADQMMFPEGTMWHAGSLYVAAPPSIWKLTDTTGMGVADRREEWFKGVTLTGCANDLHGPYLGPDGWIYWCKGAFAKQVYERPGKEPFVTRASHVFRSRPDGSGLEQVMTGGMDNPVDLVFTPGGERIITTTFFQYPAAGKRDGLIHIVYGGIYGKDHDPIHEHPWTSPAVMPVLEHLGPAAPSGLHRYESTAFGMEYKDNLFAALFNLRKVTRHILTPDGATFACRTEDFVVSDNHDFHPTDVIEDADGSLLIVDTGGWYKLCCPSSQLAKPDVMGAIYRVRRTKAKIPDDPRGLKLNWPALSAVNLANLLGDARPVVRRRARQLVQGKDGATAALWEVLKTSPSVDARLNAVWALAPFGQYPTPVDRQITHQALTDADETVRQAALNAISVWRDKGALPDLLKVLKDSSLQNRRAAAEALGRIGATSAVPDLLAAVGETTDRALEHSLTYALMEIGDWDKTAEGLKSVNPRIRRAALTVLDQGGKGKLTVETLAKELNAQDSSLKETAWWIASQHPAWGATLSEFIKQRLGKTDAGVSEREQLLLHLRQLASSQTIQALLTQQASDQAAPSMARLLALQAMAQAGLKKTPPDWFASLEKVMATGSADLTRQAVTTARALDWAKQRPKSLMLALNKIGASADYPAEVRLKALAALPDGPGIADAAVFSLLVDNLKADQPVATRGLAADVISKAKLNSAQLLSLTEAIKTAGPMELDRLLQAFSQSSDDDVGQHLLVALQTPSVRAALRVDSLKPRLAKFNASVQSEAQKLYDILDADAGKQLARLEEIVATLPAGDIRRGQKIFNNPKVACASCHTIGYVGGKVGPDLTRIGSIRNERDLLESIVFPSASFVRGYEPVLAVMRDGKTHNGLLRKDTPEEIILTLGADQEVRLARGDIEELQPGRVSVMPGGLDQQLSRQDMADLVAFLKASR